MAFNNTSWHGNRQVAQLRRFWAWIDRNDARVPLGPRNRKGPLLGDSPSGGLNEHLRLATDDFRDKFVVHNGGTIQNRTTV
jgi:hypothetical protein